LYDKIEGAGRGHWVESQDAIESLMSKACCARPRGIYEDRREMSGRSLTMTSCSAVTETLETIQRLAHLQHLHGEVLTVRYTQAAFSKFH